MAQVTVVAESHNAVTGNTTLVVNKPTGTQDGDLMIMLATRTDDVIATPSGWTLKDSDTSASGTNKYSYLFYKVASSEGSSYSITTPAPGNNGAVATIVTLRNQHGTPFDAQSKNVDTTSDSTVNGSAVTPSTSPFSLLLVFSAAYSNTGTTPPTFSAQAVANNNPTWTEACDFGTYHGGTSCVSLNCAYGVRDFITSTGAFTSTVTVNSYSTTYLVSIKPADMGADAVFALTSTQSGSESMAATPANSSIFTLTSSASGEPSTGESKWKNPDKNSSTWINQDKTP